MYKVKLGFFLVWVRRLFYNLFEGMLFGIYIEVVIGVMEK